MHLLFEREQAFVDERRADDRSNDDGDAGAVFHWFRVSAKAPDTAKAIPYSPPPRSKRLTAVLPTPGQPTTCFRQSSPRRGSATGTSHPKNAATFRRIRMYRGPPIHDFALPRSR